MKKSYYIYISLLSFILLVLLLYPNICITYALKGASLFYFKVFPSLFPFVVLCNLLIYFNGIEIYSKIFGTIITKPFRINKNSSLVIIISFLCGYPLGGKFAALLFEKGEIDFNSYNKLLSIASNPSPFFVIATVGYSMLSNIYYGYILILSCYLSCIITGLLIKGSSNKLPNPSKYVNRPLSLGEAMKNSINNGIESSLIVLSYIIIFSIIIGIIKSNRYFHTSFINLSILTHIKYSLLSSFFLSLIEMTNGCSLISSLNIPITIKLCFISFILSFSSFSIIMQVNSFIYKTNFPLNKYIKRKIYQGLISSFITFFISFFICNF